MSDATFCGLWCQSSIQFDDSDAIRWRAFENKTPEVFDGCRVKTGPTTGNYRQFFHDGSSGLSEVGGGRFA